MRAFDRTTYAREYARKQSAAKLARARAGEIWCPRKFGRLGRCDGRIETVIDRNGVASAVCPRCERFERGICRDCPAPVAGTPRKARYCAPCKKARAEDAVRRYTEENREIVNKKARKYARKVRKQRCAYKVEWRRKNPDKVKAQKRREALRQNPRRMEYLKEWRARNPEKVREYAERAKQKRVAA